MTSIDGISSVNIRADRIPVARILAKDIRLVGAGVGPQNGVFVDVVCVCPAAARMIGGEVEGVEVLRYGDDGGKGVVVSVCWRGEMRFNQLTGQEDGVGGLKVKTAGDGGEYGGGDIGPRVGGVDSPIDGEGGRNYRAWILLSDRGDKILSERVNYLSSAISDCNRYFHLSASDKFLRLSSVELDSA